MSKRITIPATREALAGLRAGDRVLLSGIIYTARDAAHQRMAAMQAAGEAWPLDWRGQAVYYAGPCPAQPGDVIGACGPTTSGRMDAHTPMLLEAGLTVMIGKGQRNEAVKAAMRETGAVYLAATGGAGALIARCVRRCDTVAFAELGAEAIYRLEVVDLPLIVAIDSQGNDLYQLGPAAYRTTGH